MSVGDFILWVLLVIAAGTLAMVILVDPAAFFLGLRDEEND